MPRYSLHYCYNEMIGPKTLEGLVAGEGSVMVEHHGRISCQFEGDIEYDSDLQNIEQWLRSQYGVTVFFNFRVLSWQPLLGEQRPANLS